MRLALSGLLHGKFFGLHMAVDLLQVQGDLVCGVVHYLCYLCYMDTVVETRSCP